MNIDIDMFKKWYESKYTPRYGIKGLLARDETYSSPEDDLATIVSLLEEFDKETESDLAGDASARSKRSGA